MDHSKAERIGPYRVLDLMGEGGSGRVFRCVHVPTGRRAAIKLPTSSTPARREALRREIATVRRLNNTGHVGVIQLFDSGTFEGSPWYAMDYVQGANLATFRRQLWDACPALLEELVPSTRPASSAMLGAVESVDARPATVMEASGVAGVMAAFEPARMNPSKPPAGAGQLELLLRVAADLADTLDLIHAEGVVHGDLAPRNVIVRARDNRPILVDFGYSLYTHLAGVARELPHVFDALHGTPGYLAPERILKGPLDPRCDLYGFGCILYELVAGRQPFSGITPADLLQQHLRAQPRAASVYVAGVPLELEQLLEQLLAKEPAERLLTAGDVAAILRSLSGENRVRVEANARPRVALYRPRLAGRSREVSALTLHIRALSDQRGGLVLLGGDSGIGKTRLGNEAGAIAAIEGVLVVSSQCRAAGGPLEPFGPVLQRISDVCADGAQAELARDLQQAMTELTPFVPEASEQEQARRLPVEAPRVVKALTHVLARFSQFSPLLLTIDDLHHTDELSRTFLSESARQFDRLGVLIIGTYRLEQVGPEFDRMLRQAKALIRIGRLSAQAVQRITKDLLGLSAVPEGLAPFIERNSEGNPFFLTEYIRAVAAEGLLRPGPGGQWEFESPTELKVPRSIDDLLAFRLKGLSESASKLLRLASILGRRFESSILSALSRLDAQTEDDALEELMAHQIIEWVAPGQYRFVHDQLREAQQAALGEQARRDLHRQAALCFEAKYRSQGLAVSARLGAHWARAGRPERAISHLSEAARSAQRSHAPARAVELYELAVQQSELLRAQSHASRAFELASLLESLADALIAQRRSEEAKQAYLRAMSLLSDSEPLHRARVHRKVAVCYAALRDYAHVDSSLEEASAALGELTFAGSDVLNEHIEIQLARLESMLNENWNNLPPLRLLDSLRPIVQRHATAAQHCRYYRSAAIHCLATGRYSFSPAAVGLARQALRIGQDNLLVSELAGAQFDLALTLSSGTLADCREALQWLTVAEQSAEQAADSSFACSILAQRVLALVRLSRVEEVRKVAHRVRLIAEATQVPQCAAAADAGLAWAAWRKDQRPQARQLAEKAMQAWGSQGAFPFKWLAGFPLIGVYLSDERFEAAVGILEQLLQSTQQALPSELDSAAQKALELWGRYSPLRADEGVELSLTLPRPLNDGLRRVIAVAQRLNYC